MVIGASSLPCRNQMYTEGNRFVFSYNRLQELVVKNMFDSLHSCFYLVSALTKFEGNP